VGKLISLVIADIYLEDKGLLISFQEFSKKIKYVALQEITFSFISVAPLKRDSWLDSRYSYKAILSGPHAYITYLASIKRSFNLYLNGK
jgi:hypothetical protein